LGSAAPCAIIIIQAGPGRCAYVSGGAGRTGGRRASGDAGGWPWWVTCLAWPCVGRSVRGCGLGGTVHRVAHPRGPAAGSASGRFSSGQPVGVGRARGARPATEEERQLWGRERRGGTARAISWLGGAPCPGLLEEQASPLGVEDLAARARLGNGMVVSSTLGAAHWVSTGQRASWSYRRGPGACRVAPGYA
jgi:hypothetical protein